MRKLTHRAVDTRAGLPSGSASYWFRTRHDLISASLDHLAELDAADVAAAGGLPVDEAEALTLLLLQWLGPHRIRTTARFELFLEAARDEELQPALARWRAAFRKLAAPLTARSSDPERAARLLVGAIDGLLLDRLTRADTPSPQEAAADARALLAAHACR